MTQLNTRVEKIYWAWYSSLDCWLHAMRLEVRNSRDKNKEGECRNEKDEGN